MLVLWVAIVIFCKASRGFALCVCVCECASCVTESKFADDAALYASTCEGFEEVTSSFVWVAGIGADASVLSPITVEGGVVGEILMGSCMLNCLGG